MKQSNQYRYEHQALRSESRCSVRPTGRRPESRRTLSRRAPAVDPTVQPRYATRLDAEAVLVASLPLRSRGERRRVFAALSRSEHPAHASLVAAYSTLDQRGLPLDDPAALVRALANAGVPHPDDLARYAASLTEANATAAPLDPWLRVITREDDRLRLAERLSNVLDDLTLKRVDPTLVQATLRELGEDSSTRGSAS